MFDGTDANPEPYIGLKEKPLRGKVVDSRVCAFQLQCGLPCQHAGLNWILLLQDLYRTL